MKNAVKLYMIRHGETVANKNNILQGQSNDHPLTELGHNQAKELGHAIRHKNWHRRYSSDLPRAVVTAKIALAERNDGTEEEGLVVSEHLREISFGIREGYPRGTSLKEARRLRAMERGVPPEEIEDSTESPREVLERQRKFVATLVADLMSDMEEIVEDRPVFCMAHGGYIHRFLSNICGMNKDQLEKIKNCAISVVRVRYNSVDDYVCEAVEGLVNLTPAEYAALHGGHTP